MLVKCTLCGEKQEITKIHKDYQRLAKNPDGPFVCFKCNNLTRANANKEKDWGKKPL